MTAVSVLSIEAASLPQVATATVASIERGGVRSVAKIGGRSGREYTRVAHGAEMLAVELLLLAQLGPLLGRARRRVDGHGHVEARVVDLVGAVLFLERDELLESMAP